jgi:hypothetical protein
MAEILPVCMRAAIQVHSFMDKLPIESISTATAQDATVAKKRRVVPLFLACPAWKSTHGYLLRSKDEAMILDNLSMQKGCRRECTSLHISSIMSGHNEADKKLTLEPPECTSVLRKAITHNLPMIQYPGVPGSALIPDLNDILTGKYLFMLGWDGATWF